MANTNDEIARYQKKMEKYASDPKVLLHCLNKLTKLPIGVEHLQATGIGRTVNGMRKAEGAVGEAARTLVNRWKEMVAAEDEKSGSEDREEEEARNSQDSDASNSHHHKSSKKVKTKESKHKESHQEEASSSRSKSGSSSRSKSPDRHKKAEKKSKETSNKDGESSSKSKSKSKSSRKRRHSQAEDSSSQPDEAGEDEEMPSRSFEDALGSIETTSKKSKKSKDKDKDKHKRSKMSSDSASSSVTSPPLPAPHSFPAPGVPAILASLPRTIDIRPTDFEISPHYKPLPLKYVPDAPPPVRARTTEEALSVAMAQKGARTKVYSGNRTLGLAFVPTLFDSCIRVLQNNISVGLACSNAGGLLRHGLSFDLLRPVLERATAQQLYDLENQNPYLLDDTDVLWESLCQREFKKAVREEMETWRELYLRVLEERERRLKNLTQNHKQSLAKAAPVRTAKMAYDNDLARVRGVGKKGQLKAVLDSMTNAKAGARPFEASGNSAANGAPVVAELVRVAPPSSARSSSSSTSSSSAAKKPKVAPLMQKTLKLMKNRFRR